MEGGIPRKNPAVLTSVPAPAPLQGGHSAYVTPGSRRESGLFSSLPAAALARCAVGWLSHS